MFTGLLHTHTLSVILFLLIYVIKTFLLLSNKKVALQTFVKKTRIAEMAISAIFLLTGIMLAINSGSLGLWFYVKVAVVAASIPLAIIGFKKENKILALVSLLLIVYAYGISETKSPVMKKASISGRYADVEFGILGSEIYKGECQSCHGADGKLGKSAAPDLTLSAKSFEEIKASVISGGKTMPAYGNQLSPDEINAVSTFVNELKP